MAVFKAFKPEAMNKIAKSMGYTGNMGEFQNYIEQDPARQARMEQFKNAAVQMAKGGVVKMQQGGATIGSFPLNPPIPGLLGPVQDGMYRGPGSVGPSIIADGPGSRIPFTSGPPLDPRLPPIYSPENNKQAADEAAAAAAAAKAPQIAQDTVSRMYAPALPFGGVTQAAMTPTGPSQDVMPGMGTVVGAVGVPTAMATTTQAASQQERQAAQMQAATAAPAVNQALASVQAAQVQPDDPRAQVTAAQQTASSVGNVQAAQGNAVLIDNPVQRNIQAGELVSAAANAQTAATFTEQVQAAEATPSTQATVQGQLAQLTANFDATNPPAWAAGALRSATAQMAARGLGASSIAGQAIVQATIEAALPIAQADAQVTAQF